MMSIILMIKKRIDIFKEDGWHSRFAVGANSLPLGMAVEIDAIFEVSS